MGGGPMSETPTPATTPEEEIGAIKQLAAALGALDAEARARVLRWAAERYGVRAAPKLHVSRVFGGSDDAAPPQFADLAELYAAADPKTEADKALVAGYWIQYVQGEPELAAQAVNAALKELGYPVSNITSAFDTLKAQTPALVMQVKKSGTTRQ